MADFTRTTHTVRIKSNDKRRGRINALRHVLRTLDYDGRDDEVVGIPDSLVVGQASSVFESSENPHRLFPAL